MCDMHPAATQVAPAWTETRRVTFALAGQPNMGKSTLFNLFTGLNQHVGNWSGKTVEKREGVFQYAEHTIQMVDLPGTYSLSANSPEEVIAREYILREQPDLVIAVVSAASLERSLYLVSELVALPSPLIVALNMMDVAEQEGIQVDVRVLEAALRVPVVPLVATRAASARSLLEAAARLLEQPYPEAPSQPEIRPDHQQVLDRILGLVYEYVPAPYPPQWAALKLLEADVEMKALMQAALPAGRWQAVEDILRQHDDALVAIASGRYEWIEHMIRTAARRPRLGQMGVTDRIDRWAAHPVIGLGILAAILGAVFWLTFTLGSPLQNLLQTWVVDPLAQAAGILLSGGPAWLSGLLVNGVIGGVGAVLTFLPVLVIFFAVFGLLEDVGYLARAAYVMDNFMHWMGLHGKSFLPLFLGFGCNVPAVMGTRVIDSRPARLLTIILAPLVPCSARLAVLAYLAPVFFGVHAALVSWGLILFTMGVLIVTGALLNRMLFKGEHTAFVMELPLYHLPNLRTTGLLVWQRSLSFVKKATTTILVFSVGVWALATLPYGNLETSFLADLGRLLQPLGSTLGFDWRLTVALVTSFVAKENSIATLGVLFGSTGGAGLEHSLAAAYNPAVGLSFLVVSLLFIPCAATVAVMRQETGSWRWTAINLGTMLALSLGIGAVVYAAAAWWM